jgi:hypothetical protein
MQVKPDDATWFHCFQISELYPSRDAFEHWNQQKRRKVYHTYVTHRAAVHQLDSKGYFIACLAEPALNHKFKAVLSQKKHYTNIPLGTKDRSGQPIPCTKHARLVPNPRLFKIAH